MKTITIISVIIGMILFVGWLNGQDIQNCIADGHSESHCYAVFNP